MSSGVSQLEYWLGTSKSSKNQDGNDKDGDKEGGSGATYLSYDVFLGLAVIGGFFALDHLYLRSPLTFLAKIAINVMFFGVWWLWDASQAVFNGDVVKVFGLGVPSLGPKGIASGVLVKDVPDKKHMSFFIYALALFITGIFGVDSFMLGDKQSGFIRLFSLLTFIFAPIAIAWWAYNVFRFIFNTKSVLNENYEYFGAPPQPNWKDSLSSGILEKIPLLGSLMGPVQKVTKSAQNAVDSAQSLAEGVLTDPAAAITGIVQGPLEKVAMITEPIIKPVTDTIQVGLKTAGEVAGTARETLALGRNALDKGTSLAETVIATAGDTAKAATAAFSLAPMAAGLTSGITPASVGAAKKIAQSGGGSSSNVLPFVLLGTFAIIAVSGFILTYRRSRQNEQPRKDDSPPEPGILRESHKEKSS
jgi:hypothetical protein